MKEKKEMIKEAQDDYESTKASVEEVESSKAATEQFNTILSNTEFCLKEIAGIFPELERLYIQPVEDVTRKRKVLSDIMMKMKKKREDAATSSAAGTPVPKEEKKKEERKPQPKRMPDDIKQKQETLKRKLSRVKKS